MGEPTCLMQVQPFSYASGLPSEANEGNPIHALGQSVSFGRFMSESLAWEKWSTFSNNRYVEEAERFSQPGSVAQKKAFFEAHYKNLAARKAAAAAAALLEKENAAASANTAPDKPDPTQDSKTTVSNFEAVVDELGQKIFVVNGNGHRPNVEKIENFDSRKVEVTDVVTGVEVSSHVENQEEKVRELSETAKLEKSISKPEREVPKKKITLSSTKSSTKSAAHTKSSTKSAAPTATPLNKRLALEPTDKKRSTPKTLHKAINFTPIRELNRITSSVIRKIENSRVGASSSKANKDISTPLRTPNTVSKNGVRQQTLNTPCSANRRAATPVNPPTSGIKPSGPKWRLLPTEKKTRSPFSSTPFSLRTEERAARRQEKLEEKFNANEAITEQLQTKVKDKPETAAGKLNPSLCFKARPLPDFYKQRKPQKNEIKKVPPVTRPQSPNLRSKPTPTKVEKRSSQTPNKPPVKNNGSKQIQGKNARSPTCSLISRPTRTTTITHENRSPNIQQG
ncbi:protein WVD2-like 7 isoform X2 [Humulus lupulus]|uniref:protein WVD2-like 7 isoform X2 n=1 Tax=Humulus lupulus TaxID=3486 RepID=UPI002B4126E8|nr:protein WVD2-like 7 isoform X2 [Humulus lupulus]